jgi:Protein of unknown function, DUF488.|nr:MAG TPA: protein of unknown function DUF488 [Caudoviricetes sp.]
MRIYTSYFGNSKKLQQAGIKVIGISLYPPRWFNGISLKQVAPTKSILFANGQTQEEYTRRYRSEVLSQQDMQQFLKTVEQASGGQDVALCCYEKPDDFCHRHILADWIKEKLGIEISEYGYTPKKEPDYVQGSLF